MGEFTKWQVVPPEVAEGWGYASLKEISGYYGIQQEDDGFCIAVVMPDADESAKIYAQRIVTAVNCHDELVEALSLLLKDYRARVGKTFDDCSRVDDLKVVMDAKANQSNNGEEA